MCELLAISSALPTTVSMSLNHFASHGAAADTNRDGWGLVYYSGDDIRRFRDIGPAADSEWVKFVEQLSLCCTLFLAHIRFANVGDVNLANTHPFSRELGGSVHTFAHNGFLKNIADVDAFKLGRYRPIGNTDSEHAFCALLDRLCDSWMANDGVPDLSARQDIVAKFAGELRELGLANFIYCDGDAMFVYSDRRKGEDGKYQAPGLWITRRTCRSDNEIISGGGVEIRSAKQQIAIAASVPLTEEGWEPLPTGTLAVMKDGDIQLQVVG